MANKDRLNAEMRLRLATDPKFRKRSLTAKRNASLKCLYGMTIDDYNRMFKKQKGCCAICHRKRRPLVVDHDHRKKFVRRLLCNPCNLGLGNFEDDMRLLARGIAYLKAMARAYRRAVKGRRGNPKKGRGRRKR